MVVEPFLVISVAALYFSVVPGRCRAYGFMDDVQLITEYIQRMNTACFPCVVKLTAIICLDLVRCIAEIDDRPLHEVHGAVAALLLVSIDKSFSAGFFNHGILVEFLTICSNITHNWNIFHVHLPLFTQFCWRIIVSQMFRFLLGRFYLLAVAEPNEYTVQRTRVLCIAFVLKQLSIQFANADIGIAAVVVANSVQLFLCMGVGMLAVRPMGLVCK